jgi:hypothetical protein
MRIWPCNIKWTARRFNRRYLRWEFAYQIETIHPTKTNLEKLDNSPSIVNHFPVSATTSLFSAIVFAAWHGAKCISLIGCDLGPGRANELKSERPNDVATEVWLSARKELTRLTKHYKAKNVSITNESWSYSD